MAKLLDELFLPEYQLVILDFIDQNSDVVQRRVVSNDKFKWDTYYIDTDVYSLKATLRYNCNANDTHPTQAEYTFRCLRAHTCPFAGCPFNNNGFTETTSGNTKESNVKFIFRVCMNLLSNYYDGHREKPCNILKKYQRREKCKYLLAKARKKVVHTARKVFYTPTQRTVLNFIDENAEHMVQRELYDKNATWHTVHTHDGSFALTAMLIEYNRGSGFPGDSKYFHYSFDCLHANNCETPCGIRAISETAPTNKLTQALFSKIVYRKMLNICQKQANVK